MPLEIGLWRLDGPLAEAVQSSGMPTEERLEAVLESNPAILGLGDLLLIDRQAVTDFGARIDLMALDSDGVVYVIELKRSRTPREVVAQTLEYGSWVAKLGAERLEALFAEGRYSEQSTLGQAFEARFGVPLPETLNEGHRLVIVASELDAGTERIVEYLLGDHGVPVNAVLFRYFNDHGTEYLARSWVRDPSTAESAAATRTKRTDPWNGRDFYITFGPEEHRAWEDGRRYGFVSAGGSRHWNKPLFQLQPGHRVFPYVPQRGYVGVGEVVDTARRINEVDVEVDGKQLPLAEAPLVNTRILEDANDPERAEYVVRVRWDRAVPREQAYREPGMFAVPISACKLRDRATLEKLYRHFEVDVP